MNTKTRMNDIMSRINFYSSSMRSMFQKSFWVRTSELLFRNSDRVDALLLRNKDAFILLGRKIWFARVATISARVRKKFFPPFLCLYFFLYFFKATILALTLILTIGRKVHLELSWHCIHYKNLLVTALL